MKTVHEVSRLTGVSVRALHYYDQIGLLKPTEVTAAGYRLYGAAALTRLHAILLFRELRFPLSEIRRILDTPGFNPQEALREQITMLEMQRDRLDAVIAQARQLEQNGGITLDFSAFDQTKQQQYADEAKRRWGSTDAYREYETRTIGKQPADMQAAGEGLMTIFAEFGAIRHLQPDCAEAQELVGRLQSYITDHFYTCTKEILHGLGQMYASGGDMTDNIDKAGGNGTATFAARAIAVYCR